MTTVPHNREQCGFSLMGRYSFPRKKGWGRESRLVAGSIKTPMRKLAGGAGLLSENGKPFSFECRLGRSDHVL